MEDKFILKHIQNKKGYSLTFIPFGEGIRKAKINAIKFREFMRNHVSVTQYDEILKEFSKDMEIKELPKFKILPKENRCSNDILWK